MAINKHRLTRYIPEPIKYQIRKEAYFGCVHCGFALGVYAHINPEFSDLKKEHNPEHNPQNMTFLCDNMNQKQRKGLLSKETIMEWKKNPWCKIHGHCHDSFDIGNALFSIWLGNTKVEKIEKIITIDDTCVLSIKKPEEPNAPFRLSGLFYDDKNNKALEIIDNEWKANTEYFEIICSNKKIGIRNMEGKFVLKLLCIPRKALVIEEINMNFQGMIISLEQNYFRIIGPNSGNVSIQGPRLFTAIEDNCSLFTFNSNKQGVTIGGGCQISTHSEKCPSIPDRKINNVGRNNPCPCGSGIKYKNCKCYPKYDYFL